MKRYLLIWMGCLALLLPMLNSCFRDDPIKIGYVSGLTGRRSELGVSSRNSVQLAVEEANKAGGIDGRKIRLIVKDNKSDPKINRQVINALLADGVVAIVGPLMSRMAKTTIATTKNTNVLVISPTVSTDELSDLDDHFIRIIPAASRQAVLASKVVVEDNIKTAAVLYDSANRQYSEPIYLHFKKLFTEQGGKITYIDDFKSGRNSNFIDIADKTIQSGAKGLLLVLSGVDAAAVCQQIRKKNKAIKFYGVYWTKTGNIIERGGRSVEGMTFVSSYRSKQKTQRFKKFKAAYQDRYKTAPGFNSIFAYEATTVLLYGIRNSNRISGEQIKQAILKKATFAGLEEDFTLNRFGDVSRKDLVEIIKDGRFARESE